MSRARVFGWVLVALFLGMVGFSCGSGGFGQEQPILLPAQAMPAPSVAFAASASAPAPVHPPCDVAAEQRARVPGLLAEGKLNRTVRVIEHADRLCPKSAPKTWEVLLATLAELGRWEDTRRVADQVDAADDATAGAKEQAKKVREMRRAHEKTTFDGKAPERMRKAYLAATVARDRKELAEAKEGFLKAWSALQPNGQALLSAGLVAKEMGNKAEAERLFDRAIVELENASGKKVVLDTPNGFLYAVGAVAWSRDGRFLAVASGDIVSIRDRLLNMREAVRLETNGPIAFSPDGKTLASGSSDQSVRLWDVATGAKIRALQGHSDSVTSVAFSPDGKTLASGSLDRSVRLWDVATGAEVRTLQGHLADVRSVAFSPDGKTLASGSKDKSMRLWDVATGAEIRTLQGHSSTVWSIAFSPNGTLLAFASFFEGSVGLSNTTGPSLLGFRAIAMHDAAYAFTPGPTPLIELLGSEAEAAAEYPICRIGALSFPFDLCRERFEVHGLYAKVLAGDSSYLDP